MNLDETFVNCIEKWSSDDKLDTRLETALDRYEYLKEGLSEDESEIISEILTDFNYYTSNKAKRIIKELNEIAVNKFKISNVDSVISVVRKEDGTCNSSYEYWLMNKEISGFSKEIYIDSLESIKNNYWENIDKVVFLDDCSGTGVQFVDFLKRQRQRKSFENKHIILIIIEIMEDAEQYIKDYANNNNLKIDVVYFRKKRKVFDLLGNEKKGNFIKLSQNRNINDNRIMGFKNAEASMAFYNNSPNDTLGIFCYRSNKNIPIFERENNERAGWKNLNMKKRRRKEQRYGSKNKS